MRWASSRCERPENSIRRFDGPVSIQCPGLTSAFASTPSRPGRRVSSVVVAVSTEIALFRDLSRREPGQRFGWDIFRDVRATCNPCVVSDLDRRFEAIVDAGPDVPPDLRPALRQPRLVREVRGDRARGDIRPLADLGVADVREVRHFRALSDAGVLHLDEGAGLGVRGEDGAGTKVTERPDED